MSRAIVIPLKCGANVWDLAGKWKEQELLHCLRSIERFWQGDDPVYLLAKSKPAWASKHLHFIHTPRYKEALEAACTVADEFVWWNDDIYLLKPTSWEDLLPVRAGAKGRDISGRWPKMLENKNGWQRKRGKVVQQLVEECGLKEVRDFSTHLPYPYNARQFVESLDKCWKGYKTPVELFHYNYHGIEWQKTTDKYGYHKDRGFPLDMRRYRFLNTSPGGDSWRLRGFLRGMFPWPSKFEHWTDEDQKGHRVDLEVWAKDWARRGNSPMAGAS